MPTIGDAVIDGFKPTASWVDNGIEWVGDVAEFYKERGAIEREAAAKLAALASKFHTKKASKTSAVSVGDHPVTTPGSLECSSMESWATLLNLTEQMAQDRQHLADTFQKHISDDLESLQTRFSDISKLYAKINEHIEEERDQQYRHCRKSKAHYDQCCESMESARAKGKKSIESKENEMNRAKNHYLIAINVSNRIKDKFYHDDLPQLLDDFQLVNEARVAETNKLLTSGIQAELNLLKKLDESLQSAQSSVKGNLPNRDSQMFVEHNANAMHWADPTDFFFEPSPIWHDNDQMYVQSQDSQQFLVALLNEANERSADCAQDSQKALKVYDNAKSAVKDPGFNELPSIQANPLLKTSVKSLEALILAESKRLETEVEIEAIETGTASVDMSHVPQTRVKVQRSLFGKKKEVVEVVGEGASTGHKSLGLTSLLARTSLGSGGSGGGSSGGSGTQALVLYDFEADTKQELSVQAGSTLELLAGDDGSGWVRLSSPSGSGLVPASYMEIMFGGKQAGGSGAAPPPPPTRGSKDPKVEVLYQYTGQDPSQLTINPGDVISVTKGDEGGWTTGVLRGQSGIFPSAYVRPM